MQKKEQSVWDKVKSSDAWEILKDATVKKSYLMEKNVWGPEAKGEILLSNSADRTYQFDANGHSGYLENAEYGGDDLPSVVNKLKEKINF